MMGATAPKDTPLGFSYLIFMLTFFHLLWNSIWSIKDLSYVELPLNEPNNLRTFRG